jgi:hypothetical protein
MPFEGGEKETPSKKMDLDLFFFIDSIDRHRRTYP